MAKLNLILATGIPLERWTHGLTVLLEKEFGSVYIDKLRVICLFEADYNWLQKLIFSKRMIDSAIKKDLIPKEQFACRHKTVSDRKSTRLNSSHRT